jgi:hypothetical protein
VQGTTAALLIGLTALPACVGSGDVPASVSGQIVGDDERPIGPGLIMVEKGMVHQGAYRTGGIIDEDGRFTVELSAVAPGVCISTHEPTLYPGRITIETSRSPAQHQMAGAPAGPHRQPTWPMAGRRPLIRMPFDDNLADNPFIGHQHELPRRGW